MQRLAVPVMVQLRQPGRILSALDARTGTKAECVQSGAFPAGEGHDWPRVGMGTAGQVNASRDRC
jgi:hypothetical protein